MEGMPHVICTESTVHAKAENIFFSNVPVIYWDQDLFEFDPAILSSWFCNVENVYKSETWKLLQCEGPEMQPQLG